MFTEENPKPVITFSDPQTTPKRPQLNKRKIMLLASAVVAVGLTLAVALPGDNNSRVKAQEGCIVTDLKGTLEHGSNHETTSPVKGQVENVAEKEECKDELWVNIYGSTHTTHEGTGWVESQQFISQQKIEVPKGKKDISIDVPNREFCWYQIDLLTTAEVRIPPVYFGNDMVDYVFVKDADSCGVQPTPTPTPTVSPTPTPSAQGTTIINNTNNNTNNTTVTVVNPSSSPQVLAVATTPVSELPKTGLPLAAIALGALTPLGLKLKKFRSQKEDESASFIWEQRQLTKED